MSGGAGEGRRLCPQMPLRDVLLGELPNPKADRDCRVSEEICKNEKTLIEKSVPVSILCFPGDRIAKRMKKALNRIYPSVDWVLDRDGGCLLGDCKYGCYSGKRILCRDEDFKKEIERKFRYAEFFLRKNGRECAFKRFLVFNHRAKDVAVNTLHDMQLEKMADRPSILRYEVVGTEDVGKLASEGR